MPRLPSVDGRATDRKAGAEAGLPWAHTAEWAPSGACSVCWEGGWHDVRLLVFGGRLYTDMVAVWRILDAIHRKHGLTCVIDGACPMGGADLLAHEWAAEHNVVSERYPVNHVTDGQWPGAGPMRNARMLRDGKPDQAVGFPGDRGTRDMDRRCRVAGIVPWHPFGQAWLLAEEPAAVAAGPRLAVVIRQSAGELASWRNRPVPLTY